MSTLQISLLVIGLLIIGGVYLFANPTSPLRLPSWLRRQSKPARRSGDDDPSDELIQEELERLQGIIAEDRGDGTAAPSGRASTTVEYEPDRIVTLFIKTKEHRQLDGRSIDSAARNVGLEFGSMSIYHRVQDVAGKRATIFSMANITNPGTFDVEHPERVQTPGLCLFLTLPNKLSALDAWDVMLAAGQRLADLLGAELLDETQSSLIRQRIAHIREEMREYDRKRELLS